MSSAMRSVAEISRVFARYLALEPRAPAPELPRGVFALHHLGLPGVFGARFVPCLGPEQRLRSTRELVLPGRCVACGAPAQEQLPLLRARLLRPAQVLLEQVPHCRRHAAVGPTFWFESTPIGADQLWEIAAPSPEVLADIVARASEGDRLPPWRAFPALSPESSGWRQGDGEAWLHIAWQPFWASLGPEPRRAYLGRWPAPAGWGAAWIELPAFASLTA